MEETSVGITINNPINSRFLLPHLLFLDYIALQICNDLFFMKIPSFFSEMMRNCLQLIKKGAEKANPVMKSAHLVSIPLTKNFGEVEELLLEDMRWRSGGLNGPSLGDEVMEGGFLNPESFKAERPGKGRLLEFGAQY